MNLAQLRQEVLDHGFDATIFTARITNYLNDAYQLITTRVNYYTDETVDDFQTVSGTLDYPQPADLAEMRSVHDTDRQLELRQVALRDLDRTVSTNGAPLVYALDGTNIRIFPTPDGVYNLEMRYWKLPALLVNDADTPTLPPRWHWLLWKYAVAECYKAEDDFQTGNLWMQDFMNGMAMFEADVKFPSTNMPAQVKGMWDSGNGLTAPYWLWP